MYDADIRATLVRNLEAADVRVVHEWSIGLSIVDVAVITPEGLHGYEIKGPRDSLARLERQAFDYGRVFDTVTLVASRAHVTAATARGLVPAFWGTVVASQAGSGPVQFERIRPAEPNTTQQPVHVAALLYFREVRALLQRRCLPYRDLGKWRMVHTLADAVPLAELRADVARLLLARPYWKADEGRRTTGKDTKPVRPTV